MSKSSDPTVDCHDLLAEKSLIGCLLLDGSVFDEISDLALVPGDFYDPRYKVLFEIICDLANSSKPVDYVTVCSKLSESQLEAIGGKAFVLEVFEDQVSAANAHYYAKVVKDKSGLRNIIRTSAEIARKGQSYNGDMDDFIEEVESRLFQLTNRARSGHLVKLNHCLHENMTEFEDPSRTPGEISGLPTGYPDLDRILLGMQSGQFIVIAARPAMGKTSLALNIMLNACKKTGLPVAMFSLEMLAGELSKRMLSSEAKINASRLRSKDFHPGDLRSLGETVQSLSNLPLFISDAGDSGLYSILSQCRKLKSEQGLGLIVIDYLQLMQSHSKNPSREQQISEISRGLKSMAKELECPVLGLSQLNRAVETRPNKRPTTADLRESGAIEQDSDVVMMIYRDEVYNPETKEEGVAEIIVAKNRMGETGTVKLAWRGEYTSFEILQHE